jgi:hypothetical protein
MALAGSEERAGCEGSASVNAIHAPFAAEVECKIALVTQTRITSRMTLSDPNRCSGCCLPSRLKIVCRNLGRGADGHHAADARSVSATWIAPTSPHAKLSRNSNQIARGRIRRFESDIPSQAVWSDRRGLGRWRQVGGERLFRHRFRKKALRGRRRGRPRGLFIVCRQRNNSRKSLPPVAKHNCGCALAWQANEAVSFMSQPRAIQFCMPNLVRRWCDRRCDRKNE